jgi:predicted transcriptional regulator
MTDKEIDKIIKANIQMAGFILLVEKMRNVQKQWRDGDPFDYTDVELAKRMDETEKKVDKWLEKLK